MATELGVTGSHHHAQKSAQRVAHQIRRLAGLFNFSGGKIGHLLHQMWPVAGDRVGRVVPQFVNRFDREPARAQAPEHHPVGAGGETVGVGENEQGHFR